MIWNLVIIALIWSIAQFGWGVEYAEFYKELIKFTNENELILSGYLVGGAFGLMASSYVFRGMGWYSLVFLLSKIAFYLSQFSVCLFSYAAVAFWFYVSHNFWVDVGYLIAAQPFIWLFASSISLWIFDFNYPVAEKIYDNILIAIISVVLVLALAFFGISL